MNKILLFSILIFISSCAGMTQRKTHDEMVKSYKTKDYKTLISRIGEKKILSRPEDRYLKSLELGALYFRVGDYIQALNFFNDAKSIASELYTIRASKKIESFLLTDSNDIYYPNPFELSLIRFYELISHYVLSKDETNPNKGFHRQAIETSLRDWHAYIDNMSSEKLGEAVFKGTVLADIMGFIFHDYLNRRKDRTIVSNFKKVSKRHLKQRMGLYPSFNLKYKKFIDDFEKLPNMPESQLMKDYIGKTSNYERVEELIDGKGINTYLVIMKGLVNPKTPNKFDIPLDFMRAAIPMNNKTDFVSFSRRIMAISAGTRPKIYFELPQVKSSPMSDGFPFSIFREGNKITEGKTAVVSNLSEVFGQILNEESAAVKTKIGSRLVVKHLALLATSYATYSSLKKQGGFIAYASAAASYSIGNKTLEQLEKADLRSWIGVHKSIEVIPLKITPGSYEIAYAGKKIKFVREAGKKQIVPLFVH